MKRERKTILNRNIAQEDRTFYSAVLKTMVIWEQSSSVPL